MQRHPVSADFQKKLLLAARDGDIYAFDGMEELFTVEGALKSLTQDQYIPLETLYETLHAMTQPVDYVYGEETRGFIFGSGPIDAFDRSSDYAPYLMNILRSQHGFAAISNTEAAMFLNSPKLSSLFSFRVTQSAQAEGVHRPYRDVMMGYRDDGGEIVKGLWDAVSQGFAENAHGHIVTITPWAEDERIFVRTELPILIHNDDVETINGLPRQDFKDQFDDYVADGMSERQAYARLNEMEVRASSIAFMRKACYMFADDLSPPLKNDFIVNSQPERKAWLGQALPVFDAKAMRALSGPAEDEKVNAHHM